MLPARFSALQRAENSSRGSRRRAVYARRCFSALQRAENSSSGLGRAANGAVCAFQCSSASRKFLKFMQPIANDVLSTFQCSSASRKFLNEPTLEDVFVFEFGFSALQRAENSSTECGRAPFERSVVSVLFSEPKIPQRGGSGSGRSSGSVSVLFSEPKIPQWARGVRGLPAGVGFSALQRAENSSILRGRQRCAAPSVSVLFSEPKIPQLYCVANVRGSIRVSVLFSEPKIPQNDVHVVPPSASAFQCSSASRKFLKRRSVGSDCC